MRCSTRLAPVVPWILALAFALPAAAEEDGDAPAVPAYGAEDLVFGADDLPAGWAACPAATALPEGAPTEAMLVRLGQAVGLDEDALGVVSRAVRRGERVAVLAWIDVDTEPAAYRAVLERSAEAGGWRLQELGSPMRLGVVGAPDAETAAALAARQRTVAVHRLVEAAWERLRERSLEGHRAGVALLRAARAIEPKAGAVAAVQGFLVSQQDPQEALRAWRHALADDTPVPVRGAMRIEVAFRLGQALLESGRDDALGTAREVLEDAVEDEALLGFAEDPDKAWVAFGNRYNLACAHARLGALEEALEVLEASLVFGKAHLDAAAYESAHRHCRTTDPDMVPLREDPRFAKLLEKHAPGSADDAEDAGGATGGGG